VLIALPETWNQTKVLSYLFRHEIAPMHHVTATVIRNNSDRTRQHRQRDCLIDSKSSGNKKDNPHASGSPAASPIQCVRAHLQTRK
jgi:hypothetical protein